MCFSFSFVFLLLGETHFTSNPLPLSPRRRKQVPETGHKGHRQTELSSLLEQFPGKWAWDTLDPLTHPHLYSRPRPGLGSGLGGGAVKPPPS